MHPFRPLSLLAVAVAMTASAQALKPVQLRCERNVDPLGVDVPAPLLSWRLESADPAARGQIQTAYELQVATSRELLAKGEADLWNTGKVTTDHTWDTAYGGKPLTTGQDAFWRVRVADRDGRMSDWSPVARWSAGLPPGSTFPADWIGCDALRGAREEKEKWGDAVWIWHAADGETPPKCKRQFRATLNVPAGAKWTAASLAMASDNHATAFVNGKRAGKASGWHATVHVDITALLQPGANAITVEGENTGADPAGLLAIATVELADGTELHLRTTGAWETSADGKTWAPARVIGKPGCAPWGEVQMGGKIHTPPAVYLRSDFSADKPVKRAMLYATALGIADFHLNGARVTDAWFTPGWTHYSARVHYRVYDVTDRIHKGANALGAVLGDGWFSGYVGYGHRREHYGKKPRVAAWLRIEYADGTEQIVKTGPDWKAATGSILAQDFLMGETYDARLEAKGWDAPGFEAKGWSAVDVGNDEVKPAFEWHPGPPVIAFAAVKPVAVTEPTPGVYVFNLGQNFAGIPRLKVKGEPGQKIVLHFAERLNPDGTAYTENYRSARSIDTYICRGGGVETWEPRLTFHGFQYVQIEGLAAKPTADTVTGLALGSDTPNAGSFGCSDAMLNQLGSNTWWTQRANFLDIPTDCPQRDERLGWTGDAQMYIRTASLHADVQSFFQKWFKDLSDSQKPDGQYACVAPPLVAPDGGGPAWADAGSVCPWVMYDVYGDRRALERMYPGMKRLIDSYKNRCSADLKPPAKYHCFGDWLSINADTPKDIILMAYFALSTRIAMQTAEVLGRPDEAADYRALLGRIKQAFNRDYVEADGKVRGDTQTGYVLALQFDLVEGKAREAAAKHLVDNIAAHDFHLTTGFVGTKDLMLVLSKIGRTDLAYRLIHNDTFPSWGFSIKNGATTIWERWNGWTPEQGFGDAGMNSFAHYAFGAVYQWMVENIGGIRGTAPAFRRIAIAPVADDKLTFADVSYDSLHGRVASSWKKTGAGLALSVEVPPNTTAEIHVPTAKADAVLESGKPAASAPGVKFLRAENGAAVFEVGSGRYAFTTGG